MRRIVLAALLASSALRPALAEVPIVIARPPSAGTPGQPNGAALLGADGTIGAIPVLPTNTTQTRPVQDVLGDAPSIVGLGADPTGVADSTAAFNAARNSNRDYWVPPGRYKIAGCLQFDMMGLRGPGIYQRTNPGDVSLTAGAVLAFQPSTKACPAHITTTRGGVSIQGLTFYWPEQNGSQAPAPAVLSGAVAAGATTIPLTSTTGIAVGALVFGGGIPAMERVLSVSGSSITVESPTTAAIASGAQISTWLPVVYPPLLANGPGQQLVDLTFDRNVVVNAYDLLHLTADVAGAGDWRISENRIAAFHRAFDLLGATGETTQVSNNDFTYGIFGTVALGGNGYLSRFANLNAEWLHVDAGAGGSIDGMTAIGNLIHGYRYGERVLSGVLNLFQGIGNTYDGVGTLLSVENTGAYIGSQYGGAHVLGMYDSVTGQQQRGQTYADPGGVNHVQASIGNVGISFNASGPIRASFDAMNVGYTGGDAIEIIGPGPTVVSFRGGAIENYGLAAPGGTAYGMLCPSASADVTISTTFRGTGTGTQTGLGVNGCGAMVAAGNVFDGMVLPVLAYSGGSLVLSGNVARGTTGNTSYQQFPSNFASLKSSGNSWDIESPGHVGWPAVRATVAAGQTIGGGGKTQVAFGSLGFDDTGAFANSTFTAPVAGYYKASVKVAQSGTGTVGDVWTLSIDQAGSFAASYARDYVMSVTVGAVQEDDLVYLAKGDTVQVSLARASGNGSWSIPADASRSSFAIQLVQ